MAFEDVVPVEHFKNAPHGTQVKDASAPSAADATEGLAGVFIGYPDCVTVVAAATSVIWATSDIVITDGVPTLDTPTWIELGIVGATGFLRIDRVRYAFMRATDDSVPTAGVAFTVHTGELNVIEDTPATLGLDE